MMGTLRQMLTCHWSARRIQRYLDADPAARLTPGEISRLEEHLATCEKCTQVAVEHRALHRALSLWSGGTAVAPESVERVRDFLSTLTDESTLTEKPTLTEEGTVIDESTVTDGDTA